MNLRYISVCSGIEAATVAWHPLGWKPVAFSEIEKFPSAVLVHHYPDVPNYGDMTKFNQWPKHAIDLLVGGTPCQSFSVAGLRKGLEDPRGNLTLTFLSMAKRYRPRWVVWENVPGVLSDKTNAFGQLLSGLAELGYGWSYRVLDAQFFGLAQRRRRVFVVAHLGDWQSAGAVLFEPESLRGDSPPSRKTGEEVAGAIGARTGLSSGAQDAECGHMIAHPLSASYDGSEDGTGRGTPLVADTLTKCRDGSPDVNHGTNNLLPVWPADIAPTLNAAFGDKHGLEDQHALNGAGLFVPVAFDCKQSGQSGYESGDVAPTLRSMNSAKGHANGGGQIAVAIPVADQATRHAGDNGSGKAVGKGHGLGVGKDGDPMFTLTEGDKHSVAFAENSRGELRMEGGDGTRTGALSTGGGKPGQGVPMVASPMAVRRLTPRECERLQGFPDDYTQIPWRKKVVEDCPDGPRYKALGNSMAVPVMSWIGKRIEQVEGMLNA